MPLSAMRRTVHTLADGHEHMLARTWQAWSEHSRDAPVATAPARIVLQETRETSGRQLGRTSSLKRRLQHRNGNNPPRQNVHRSAGERQSDPSPSRWQRPTSTAVTCVPGSVAVGQGSVCTRPSPDKVRARSPIPRGRDLLELGLGRILEPDATCTLVSDGSALTFTSSCSATYTPSARSARTRSRDYDEASSATHASSNGTFALAVTARPTTTAVNWRPAAPRSVKPATAQRRSPTTAPARSPPDRVGELRLEPAQARSEPGTVHHSARRRDVVLLLGDVHAVGESAHGTHTDHRHVHRRGAHAGSSGTSALTVTKRSTSTT